MLELRREPALDVGLDLGPEPEPQAAAAHALEVPGGLRERERRAREGDRDRGAEAHPAGRERRREQRQERVVGGLDAPQPVRPEPLVARRLAADRPQVIAAQPNVDLHPSSPAALADRSRQPSTSLVAVAIRSSRGRRS